MFSLIKSLFKKSNTEVEQALNAGAVVIDVRTKPEFSQGHYKGSKNIPLNELKLKTAIISNWNKPVITVCRSGTRSGMAKGILQAAGIEVYNGGAWTNLK